MLMLISKNNFLKLLRDQSALGGINHLRGVDELLTLYFIIE